MTELLTLMTHVSDQGAPANGRQVQHPSDFTRRYILLSVKYIIISLWRFPKKMTCDAILQFEGLFQGR